MAYSLCRAVITSILFVLPLWLAAWLPGCTKRPPQDQQAAEDAGDAVAHAGGSCEQNTSRQAGELRANINGKATKVVFVLIGGQAVFEGDILLPRPAAGEVGPLGIIITGEKYRWPTGKVPYTIDPGLNDQQRVTDAIQHWHEKTNVRFHARTNEKDYVTFRPSNGCSAQVGRQGGQQFVNLADGCSKGNVIHEIGHAVGLWHEQSREDRDRFVTIHKDNISPGMEHNFNQHINDGDDVNAYDYGSIMHYPRNAFAKDPSKDTITPKDPGKPIGQRTALSPGDIATVKKMYP